METDREREVLAMPWDMKIFPYLIHFKRPLETEVIR